MSPAAPVQRPAPFWAALAFGAWAAAIAFQPLLALPVAAVLLVWWTLRTSTRWLGLFLAAALLLPPLPIPIGDSGPHPSLIFAALGPFAGILWMSEWRYRPDSLNHAFIALFGVLLASVGAAAVYSGEIAAAGSLTRVLLFGISVYVYFYTAHGPGRGIDSARSVRLLYAAAVAAALFACVDFYFQFPAPAGYGPQFVWLDSGIYRRAQGLFYEASTLGNFCAFFLVMAAVALSRPREQSPVARKWLVPGAAVLLAALVLSYSRASLLNLAAGLAVLAWHNRRRVPLWRVAALAAAAGLATWLVFPVFVEAYWLRLSASAKYFFSATEGVLSGRVASWRTLVDWAAANPWQALSGIGYKTLPYTDYLGAPVVADNMYLSLLVETGVAGLAALLWLNVAIVRTALRARDSLLGTWMLCFWSGQMVQMLSGDLLTYWRVLPVYFFVLALART
ncbi:MAG TPA: O-antigen ligase family protein [Verrucomicrobiae bacterium]|nr:O-antigen ligase family protein [Verrucomicrobiae bacterium]